MRKTRGGWGETGGEFVACEQETYFRLSLRLVKLETRAEKNGRSHRITNLKT